MKMDHIHKIHKAQDFIQESKIFPNVVDQIL